MSKTLRNYYSNSEQKENDKSSETNHAVTEIYNPNDREFKIVVIKKLEELQENSERWFNELRNKIIEKKEYSTKEIKIIKKNSSRNSGGEEHNS